MTRYAARLALAGAACVLIFAQVHARPAVGRDRHRIRRYAVHGSFEHDCHESPGPFGAGGSDCGRTPRRNCRQRQLHLAVAWWRSYRLRGVPHRNGNLAEATVTSISRPSATTSSLQCGRRQNASPTGARPFHNSDGQRCEPNRPFATPSAFCRSTVRARSSRDRSRDKWNSRAAARDVAQDRRVRPHLAAPSAGRRHPDATARGLQSTAERDSAGGVSQGGRRYGLRAVCRRRRSHSQLRTVLTGRCRLSRIGGRRCGAAIKWSVRLRILYQTNEFPNFHYVKLSRPATARSRGKCTGWTKPARFHRTSH